MSEQKYEPTGLEIAVIGMAGRFPGANNIHEFWDNLKNGVESISFFSDEELIEAGTAPGQLENPDYVKTKGILEGIEYFDASFFDYRSGEVEKMDPQIRVFHECTWEALENAGYDPLSYKGSIGLYAGATSNFHWMWLLNTFAASDAAGSMAAVQLVGKDFLTTCLSYKFNLKGPSFPIQTACSTSLLAIHLACQGLLSGECDIALAGGVSVTLPKKNGYQFHEGMLYSPDGHNRSFDEKAGGTVFGNGVGIVVLKSLQEAITEGDTIYAMIKGSAINNDGNRKVGFTAPSTKGQAEVIHSAIKAAEIEPETISYIEAHGTGTSIGDPIEIEALKLAFDTDKKGFCRIGSVKSNIGHMDTAAGVAGFIKIVLSLKYRLIPPSLHFENPNPRLDLENTPFYLNTELTPWKNDKYPLRAGISSFGFGGTNAHVILEEAPEGTGGLAPLPIEHPSRQYQLILLSAKTPTALESMTKNLAEHFKKNLLNRGNHENLTNPGLNLADAAYTLQVGRSIFKHKRMVVSSDAKDTIEALESPGSEKVQTFSSKKEKKSVVFMFPGQGAQYINMGLELYQSESVFRDEMDCCFEILKPLMGYDIKDILYPHSDCRGGSPCPPQDCVGGPEQGGSARSPGIEDSPLERGTPDPRKGGGVSKINQTEITQPVIFAFEYALAKLLMTWGIKPDAMIGHSIGEYVAACLSGVFSLEHALKLVVIRGKLMQKIPPGAMLSIQLPGEELESILSSHPELSLAAVNTPELHVVSGPHEAIHGLANQLKEKGYESKLLHTSHAFHSAMMDPILKEFEENVSPIPLNKPQIPYISNVTGNWITHEQASNPGYWSTHLRKTIQFSTGLRELTKKQNTTFVEVGPGRVLSTFARKHPDRNQQQMMINLARHPKENVSDLYFLLTKIGQLWLYGVTIDWQGFYPGETRHRISLPAYPFERQRYWKYMDDYLKKGNKNPRASQPLKRKDMSEWFYIPSWKRFTLPLKPNAGKSWSKQSEPTQWLVFTDEYGLGTQLVEQLETGGHDVVTVEPGTGYGKVSDHCFVINAAEASDYTALLHELLTMEKVPDAIVHLWSIHNKEREELETGSIEKSLETGFYSLLFLARAIGKHHITNKIRLTIVTSHMQEVTGQEELVPEKAMVLGMVKVLPQEYLNIKCRSIDLDLPNPGTTEQNQLIRQLTTELMQESNNTVIAFRGNHRWVQTYEPVNIPPLPGNEGINPESRLREKGVYLITGGLGGIGLALAEYLARNCQARLILTGRSPFPSKEQWQDWLNTHSDEDTNNKTINRKIRKLMELEAHGAEVMVLRADAANQEYMQAVITTAENHFGALHGVIHAAGTVKGNTFLPIDEIGKTQCENHFLPKIYGLLVLEKVLQNKQLDFCLLTSSLSSVLGGLGYIGYAAANIFMDAFVYKHNRENTVKWTSVNLDHWDTREKSETDRQSKTQATAPERMAMTPTQGVQVLQRVLSWGDVNQMVVSTGNLHARINQWINLEPVKETQKPGKEEPSNTHVSARPDLSTPYVTPASQMEEIIANTWQKFLGIEKVGIHDNFFDLGATSLDIVQVNNQLKEALNRHIPVVRMFEFPTVSSLAQKLSAEESSENLYDTKKDRSSQVLKGRQVLQDRLQLRKQGVENV